jgi:hypothetical protein
MSVVGLDIKNQIDLINKQIEEKTGVAQFTLNSEVAGLLLEIDSLQAQCPHEFHDGYCIYCYKMEGRA